MKPCKSVILVEDEPMIALMICDMVMAQGFAVVGVFRGNGEALTFLREHRPDAAIVDYALTDGPASPLALMLRQQGTPFCIVSGYDRSVAGPMFRDVVWIDKPFSADQMCDALRTCMDEPMQFASRL